MISGLARDIGERFIVSVLASVPGVPAKFAQLLGMRDMSQVPKPRPMSVGEVRQLIAERSPQLERDLVELNSSALNASIGQVHQGRMADGRSVAVKIQYPGVAEKITSQINILCGVAKYSPARKFEFDAEAFKTFVKQKMTEECDYIQEACNQTKFRKHFEKENIHIPQVLGDYSSSSILVQEWVPSVTVQATGAGQSLDVRNQCAALLTKFLMDSMFGLGAIHSDLNPDNFGFVVDGEVVKLIVYDFGSVTVLPNDFGLHIQKWIAATNENKIDDLLDAMHLLGFARERLEPIKERLMPLSRVLLKPFTDSSPWNSSEWQLEYHINQILGEHKWWFRTAGAPWFLFLMRAVHGWHSAMMCLKTDVDLRPADKADPWASLRHETFLHVIVNENQNELVHLTLPGRSVSDLEFLVPEHVIASCQSQNIDLKAIKSQAIASGLAPQELFRASSGARTYRVWLEV